MTMIISGTSLTSRCRPRSSAMVIIELSVQYWHWSPSCPAAISPSHISDLCEPSSSGPHLAGNDSPPEPTKLNTDCPSCHPWQRFTTGQQPTCLAAVHHSCCAACLAAFSGRLKSPWYSSSFRSLSQFCILRTFVCSPHAVPSTSIDNFSQLLPVHSKT